MADKQPKGQRVPGTNTFDVQEPSAPLTPEEKRKNAAALAKQKADEKKPINPDVSQEPTKLGFGGLAMGRLRDRIMQRNPEMAQRMINNNPELAAKMSQGARPAMAGALMKGRQNLPEMMEKVMRGRQNKSGTAPNITISGPNPIGGAMKEGGKVKCYAKGGSVSSASSRADGCASKGKTKYKVY